MEITFIEIARRYLESRVVSGTYDANVRRIAGRCRVVTKERLNAYLQERLKIVSPLTCRSERTILLTLWKWAYENELIDAMPRGVLRIKTRKPPTRAWTVEQLQHAIAETAKYDTTRLRSGARLGQFLRAWILLGYEAGARRGDLFSMTSEHIDGDTLRWTQAKTGDPIVKVLSPACLEAVGVMLAASPDGSILRWACGRRMSMRWMRVHLDRCGLVGTSKWLRRSGATHIEMVQPGKASLHLGHRTATLAAQAYIDWGQVRKTTPVTPRLMEVGQSAAGHPAPPAP
jgi:integrase